MRPKRSLDTRAIAGTPIRVVIALAVTVAAMGVITAPLADIKRDSPGETEVTVRLDQMVVSVDAGGSVVRVSVVTEEGRPVTDTAVLVRGGSLPLEEGPTIQETGPDSNAVHLHISTGRGADLQAQFRPRQSRGTLEIDVVALGADRTDDRENPDLTVIDGG